mmetsp:Transcript_34806/g.80455  ORF Transcript_34806/g.80455 Transcript_34806/m.80455 type:complete len:363 (-) Transcript_34806:223-1311(-)
MSAPASPSLLHHASDRNLHHHIVIPGQVLVSEPGFLRGHGTYTESANSYPSSSAPRWTIPGSDTHAEGDNEECGDAGFLTEFNGSSQRHHEKSSRLIACQAGTVRRIHRLLSVAPAASPPYAPSASVGDLVVGRVSQIQTARWTVRLGPGCRDAPLPLSSVNLPGGVQRIRTSEDALTMSKLFAPGDLLSAEVAKTSPGGDVVLHTRSLRYGKLENGTYAHVPSHLIRRRAQHIVTLPPRVGCDVLLGLNGGVWIQRTYPTEWTTGMGTDGEDMAGTAGAEALAEDLQKVRKRHADTPMDSTTAKNMIRVRNAICCLGEVRRMIDPDTIVAVYDESLKLVTDDLGSMLDPAVIVKITECVRR